MTEEEIDKKCMQSLYQDLKSRNTPMVGNSFYLSEGTYLFADGSLFETEETEETEEPNKIRVLHKKPRK